jgi:hypothetical protein
MEMTARLVTAGRHGIHNKPGAPKKKKGGG